LASNTTLEAYTDWMKGLISDIAPDGKYVVTASAFDSEKKAALFHATFSGTHTGAGGPVKASDPPKAMSSQYVYCIFVNEKNEITRMNKVWNDAVCMKSWGWA
jgi:hypothetical protein